MYNHDNKEDLKKARQEALKWWKTLSLDKKDRLVKEWEDNRDARTLTTREIQLLHQWNISKIHTKP